MQEMMRGKVDTCEDGVEVELSDGSATRDEVHACEEGIEIELSDGTATLDPKQLFCV